METIKASGNDLIVQVKANQPKLLQDSRAWVETHLPQERHRQPGRRRHGRFESRQLEVYPLPPDFGGAHWQGHWKVLIVVHRFTQLRVAGNLNGWAWREQQPAYYLSTCSLPPWQFNQAIREHWHIENRLHYVLDVSLEEDRCRCQGWATIWGAIRRTAFNLLRLNGETAIRDAMYCNALNLDNVLNYRGI